MALPQFVVGGRGSPGTEFQSDKKRGYQTLKSVVRFFAGDERLVTLEWVELAAAVIVQAIGIVVVIQGQANTAASTIGSKIVSTDQSNS